MLLVLGAVEENDVLGRQLLGDQLPELVIGRIFGKLLLITVLEFVVLGWIVAEPLPQVVAGADLLEPFVQVGVDLGDPRGQRRSTRIR